MCEINRTDRAEHAQSPCARASELMRSALPVKGHDKMENVLIGLKIDRSLAAPVVNEMGQCIGVLTMTDIEQYFDVKEKYRSGDMTALDAIFETDQFGMRRINIQSFDLVCRHMTQPPVCAPASISRCQAKRLFRQHSDIHHLIIVDERQRPIGVLELSDLENAIDQHSPA